MSFVIRHIPVEGLARNETASQNLFSGVTMREYIHHIPGRLRIRGDWRENPAARLADIRGVSGVTGADFNARSRSVLIHYQPDLNTGEAILEQVIAMGLIRKKAPFAPPAQVPKLAKFIFKAVARNVVGRRIPLGLGTALLGLI